MPVKLNCPRCKKPLAVPSKKVGGYVNCPQCEGRFWVPETASDSNGSSEVMAVSPPSPRSNYVSPAPPPLPRRKVAHFISAEAAQSELEIAENGKLPELHLQEGHKKEERRTETSTVNPLVLFGVLSMSVVLSITLVLYDAQPQQSANSRQKADARRIIEDEYFGDQELYTDPENARPLKPYQVYLREAHRAHSRTDRKTERRMYRKVLDLLRAERSPYERVTPDDERLRRQISVLLSEE